MNSSINQLRREAMQLAWQLVKKASYGFSAAIKRAYVVIKLKMKLATTDEKGQWISYRKDDGTTRNALATRNLQHVPVDKQPKKQGDSVASAAIKYFDILADGWRSFRADRIILTLS